MPTLREVPEQGKVVGRMVPKIRKAKTGAAAQGLG
jgi:hypothetical protein